VSRQGVYYVLIPLIIVFGFLRWRLAMRRVHAARERADDT
jgi:hypothetical protein